MPFVQQLYAFGMTVVAGTAAGIVFDFYRFARRGMRAGGGMSWLLDLMFWFVVTPLVFSLLLVANWGELRFYVVVGLGAGGAFYFGLLSPFVLQSMDGLLWALGRVLTAVGYVVVGLLMLPVRIVHAVGGAGAPLGRMARRRPAAPFAGGWRGRRPFPGIFSSWSSFGRRA